MATTPEVTPEHEPKTERERNVAKAARAQALKESREKMKQNAVSKQVSGFMDFVRTQGVVGLAVGLAIGTQASELVKSIVASIITPLVDLIVGKGGLKGVDWTIHIGNRTATFTLGLVLDAIIRFLAIAFVIYFVVKGLKLDKLDKKKDA
jgi:large conductance mechanosensitive channel